MSRNEKNGQMPAFETRQSIRPNSATPSATICSTLSSPAQFLERSHQTHLLRRLGIRDISSNSHRPPSQLRNLRLQNRHVRRRSRVAQVVQNELSTLRCESECDTASNALRGAGNDHDLVVEEEAGRGAVGGHGSGRRGLEEVERE